MRESSTALLITEDVDDQIHVYPKEILSHQEKGSNVHSLPFNYSEASDEALVDLYANCQSDEAFNEIVSRYKDIITGFAMKLCRNTHDAEDIRQDVLLILATKLHTFKGNSKFSTWLYRVTLNTCYKYLKDSTKKTKNETNLDENFPNQYSAPAIWTKNPDEIMSSREQMEIVGRAVDALPDSNKEIFNLKEINGYSNAELVQAMGISLSAVKSRVLRTRIAIRDKISAHI